MDRDGEAAGRTVERIQSIGGVACAHVGDVRSTPDCDVAARTALDAFGRLDIVVNNAAILGQAKTLDYRDEDLAATLDVNLMGARMARSCRPHLGPGFSIVNVASLGALRTFGMIDYEASKGAMLTITNTLAVQLGPSGIGVNAVTHGFAIAVQPPSTQRATPVTRWSAHGSCEQLGRRARSDQRHRTRRLPRLAHRDQGRHSQGRKRLPQPPTSRHGRRCVDDGRTRRRRA
jgi:NAD(P)-dependent dehydrogenase (short-subunit alcohol dehydrogenase family)